ncbi:hypothetical protein EDB19DRAFT_1655329 [Suillus lakei]|nr:hypothetical protein EDB19DRAFT_1655329 [Suillus lakei]
MVSSPLSIFPSAHCRSKGERDYTRSHLAERTTIITAHSFKDQGDHPVPLAEQNPEFALLPARHTTAGDNPSPNEAIHLTAAMQFSGYFAA